MPSDECLRLIAALDHGSVREHNRAFRMLQKKTRLQCLEWALDSPSVRDGVKTSICELLHLTRWPEAIPVLVRQLRSDNPDVRAYAADTLADIGDVSAEAVSAGPELIKLLQDPTQPTFVQATVANALGSVVYRPAWPLLVAQLHHPEWSVRRSAAWALKMIGEPRAVPALKAALVEEQDGDILKLIKEALEALRKVSQDATGE